jgi:hypothetical protein
MNSFSVFARTSAPLAPSPDSLLSKLSSSFAVVIFPSPLLASGEVNPREAATAAPPASVDMFVTVVAVSFVVRRARASK